LVQTRPGSNTALILQRIETTNITIFILYKTNHSFQGVLARKIALFSRIPPKK
jgi:hypothetical protein